MERKIVWTQQSNFLTNHKIKVKKTLGIMTKSRQKLLKFKSLQYFIAWIMLYRFLFSIVNSNNFILVRKDPSPLFKFFKFINKNQSLVCCNFIWFNFFNFVFAFWSRFVVFLFIYLWYWHSSQLHPNWFQRLQFPANWREKLSFWPFRAKESLR